MKTTLSFVIASTVLLLPAAAQASLPKGWASGGYRSQGYEADVDAAEALGGSPALVIRSTPAISLDGEANIGTSFLADQYRGKRVRFTAQLKIENVGFWCGLWMRVTKAASTDGAAGKNIRFDNMRSQHLQGTKGWAPYQIVLDVPAEAATIGFGFHIVGAGKIWMSKPALTVVGPEVPVTSSATAPAVELPAEPQLDLTRH